MTHLTHCDALKDWDDLKYPLEGVTTFQNKPWAKISCLYSQNWPFGFYNVFWLFFYGFGQFWTPINVCTVWSNASVTPEVFKFLEKNTQLKIQSLYSHK